MCAVQCMNEILQGRNGISCAALDNCLVSTSRTVVSRRAFKGQKVQSVSVKFTYVDMRSQWRLLIFRRGVWLPDQRGLWYLNGTFRAWNLLVTTTCAEQLGPDLEVAVLAIESFDEFSVVVFTSHANTILSGPDLQWLCLRLRYVFYAASLSPSAGACGCVAYLLDSVAALLRMRYFSPDRSISRSETLLATENPWPMPKTATVCTWAVAIKKFVRTRSRDETRRRWSLSQSGTGSR